MTRLLEQHSATSCEKRDEKSDGRSGGRKWVCSDMLINAQPDIARMRIVKTAGTPRWATIKERKRCQNDCKCEDAG